MVGINTNIAAYYAQLNIGKASSATSASVARLSSGNRIVQASDDVAALAAGTSLKTQVSTLKTALGVAAQGTSLLQVADGALSQIGDILQRQKAISTQAQSGSLSDTQRSFLNQEFQSLTQEIDQLATSTNFNGVSLINGSLTGSNPLRSANVGSGSSAAAVSGFTASGTISALASVNSVGTGNDISFYGDLSEGTWNVTQNATTTSTYDVSFSINGANYQGQVASGATSIIVSNGLAAINITTTALGTSATAANVTNLKTALTTAFSGATAYAKHVIRSTDATDPVTSAVLKGTSIATTAANGSNFTNGTLLQGFSGAGVNVQSAQFSGAQVPSISNFSATTSSGSLSGLSLQLNGQTYSTGIVVANAKISAATFGGGSAGIAAFYLNGDTSSNEKVTLDFTSIVADATDDTTVGGVANIVAALNHTFGSGGTGLSFQVGATSADSIGVTIGNATSDNLFSHVAQDVTSQANAVTASTALDGAINSIITVRSNVGALQSRFNFASNAIQNAVQNQDAARGVLLDTDVATESTAFSTSQIQLQAGIAVLAQANQLTQNLLKLIA